MPTEFDLKDDIHDRLKVCQHRGLKLWFLKIHGHPMQRGGVPDFLVCYGGRFKAVELKRNGEQPTPLQVMELHAILRAGGVADVATSWLQMCEILLLPEWCKTVPRK